ncbi:DUF5919 domain-containing protein [Dactylosporangium sp. NPDC051541]|uniref:DUF5919 domain-containing protein n=1 Tax=Dactylosporangium sp. NPDC051541 TaxID=3363977 RepID=UPI0037B45B08
MSSDHNVVDLRRHAAYKPDLASLARGQVAAARQKLGLDYDEFADVLAPLLGWSPSPEIVEGWETRAVPPGDVLLAVGLASQDGPHDVLPVALNSDADRMVGMLSTMMGDLERIMGSPDVVRAYAMRGLIARPEWNNIIRNSRGHIWLYGMAEYGYALDDEVPEILAAAAKAGCDIRVLLLDPQYTGTGDIDADEGNPAGTLSPRIRAALTRFRQMSTRCEGRMHVRTYNAPPTVSIVRADGRMLVTPYLRFFVGSNSPTFELRESADGKMFGRYTRHFETMWDLAEEWTA